MYYWKDKTEQGTTLEEELLNCNQLKNIHIASAFLSRAGIEIMRKMATKYKLKPENILLYLSPQFSLEEPDKLLQELKNVCTPYIVFTSKLFHPKVYWLEMMSSSKLIFGSSNFTNGGLQENIEFDAIIQPDNDSVKSVELFFQQCEKLATYVDQEVIDFYKNNRETIVEMNNEQKRHNKLFRKFINQNDPFSFEDYELDNAYFSFSDYEAIFPRNAKLNTKEIANKRQIVQNKMLLLHDHIYPAVKKMGLNSHWSKNNITSLIKPCVFNHGMVNWVGIRYGKTKEEFDLLKIPGSQDADELIGFQKHACLQFCIINRGFEINLFLAVKNDAVDRAYLHQHIDKLRPKIESEIKRLQGNGFFWAIGEGDDYLEFVFDDEDAADFVEFFKANDKAGKESYLAKFYSPDAQEIKTSSTIEEEILFRFAQLLPLYNLVAWRLKK